MSCGCPLPPGTRECHCTVCDRHFSTPGTFDRHRSEGRCRDPKRIGLVAATRRGVTVWSYPPREEIDV